MLNSHKKYIFFLLLSAYSVAHASDMHVRLNRLLKALQIDYYNTYTAREQISELYDYDENGALIKDVGNEYIAEAIEDFTQELRIVSQVIAAAKLKRHCARVDVETEVQQWIRQTMNSRTPLYEIYDLSLLLPKKKNNTQWRSKSHEHMEEIVNFDDLGRAVNSLSGSAPLQTE